MLYKKTISLNTCDVSEIKNNVSTLYLCKCCKENVVSIQRT